MKIECKCEWTVFALGFGFCGWSHEVGVFLGPFGLIVSWT